MSTHPSGSGTPRYLVEIEDGPVGRDTVGGIPVLPAGESWPHCHCGTRMVLFFQLDIPADVPVFGRDHLLVFQCTGHNEGFSADVQLGDRLPERFWDHPPVPGLAGVFWRILLYRNGSPTGESEPHLVPRRLTVRPEAEELDEYGSASREFKIGGVPSWLQDPEQYRCACGAELEYLAEVPADHGFERQPGQPEQPHTPDPDAYVLFLGNELYLHACPAHCHPAAVWPIMQN